MQNIENKWSRIMNKKTGRAAPPFKLPILLNIPNLSINKNINIESIYTVGISKNILNYRSFIFTVSGNFLLRFVPKT